MKFLVIGLGSMGKRRIRCLNALNQKNIAGFDIRRDRRAEAKKNYKIKIFEKAESAIIEFNPDALIISTSPKFHMKYAHVSLKYNIPCFIEASVCNLKKIEELHKKNLKKKILIAPSCTMIFNEGIERVKDVVNKKLIGDINYINYHVGQYLPDWHPWEKKGHYVWDKDSNGCKELIPFELTWLHDLFGKIFFLNSINLKLSDLKINFNDLTRFSILLKKKILADITIEVLSRPTPTRELTILGSKGKIILSADQQVFKYTNTKLKKYKSYSINTGKIVKGYVNSEKPYIKEIKSFINSVKYPNKFKFPNTLKKDIMILKIMNRIIKIK
jgi:predicted dehydrogenase